jgi:RNA polymerase sigma-70 factor, ECF subfamily
MAENELAFKEIYDTFRPRIVRYLTRMIGETEAEDLTQEVLVKVSQALKTFRGESQLSTWIYQIATNAALDKRRSRSFRETNHETLATDSIEESRTNKDVWTGETKPPLEQQLIRKEMNGCIHNVINKLSANYRTVIVLSELEGFKDNEIAEIIRLSLQATKIRLHRARARLRKELETYCILSRDERNEFACDQKNIFGHLLNKK